MPSLLLRNLVFTILQPGIVAGLIPFLIVRDDLQKISVSLFVFHHYLGFIIIIIGLLITLHCILQFVIHGRGTLSPADPTKQLVGVGLYRFSRNPMYVGVILILVGEVVSMQSIHLLLYTIVVFFGFHAFIVFIEEPRLKRDFGKEYTAYRHQVRRWI